jgi:DNA-binding LytR/AlgR family response regulator
MTAPLRERPAGAVHASPVTAQAIVLLRNIAFPAVIVGGFLAFIGAFESGMMPLLERIPFMVAISFVASAMGFGVFQLAAKWRWAASHWWRRGMISAVLMFGPMAMVVWVAINLVAPPSHRQQVADIPGFLGISLVTSAFFCLLVAWLRRDVNRETADAAPAPPKFLERLPLRLRGAEVWAVEAEDHYLRLHTSKGQDLILMRLADAVAELDGIEGAQVHRSWWVARDAIVDAKRGDGRATLTLKDGAEVPVSRTYAGEIREKGWI